MQHILEPFQLGLRDFFRPQGEWQLVGLVVHLYILAAVIGVFFVGRRLYKQGRWQARRPKIAVGVVFMAVAVCFYPALVYSVGVNMRHRNQTYAQYMAAAPERQEQARQQAIASFKQHITTFKGSPYVFYGLPPAVAAPDGTAIPTTLVSRDTVEPENNVLRPKGSFSLKTTFTAGHQSFEILEGYSPDIPYRYTSCTTMAPECLAATSMGQAHCYKPYTGKDMCELLLSSGHVLRIQSNGTPATIHPAAVYNALSTVQPMPPANLPLLLAYEYCPSGGICRNPYREVITQAAVE